MSAGPILWETPALWVATLAQVMVARVLDGGDSSGKVTRCPHRPEVSLTAHQASPQPAVYDADTDTLRCLACFSLAWGTEAATSTSSCMRCGEPGQWHIAPVHPYPSVRVTVTVCPQHGPQGGSW